MYGMGSSWGCGFPRPLVGEGLGGFQTIPRFVSPSPRTTCLIIPQKLNRKKTDQAESLEYSWDQPETYTYCKFINPIA